MTDDRINAILALAGGILVFLAAMVPIIRAMFKKLTKAPNKEQIVAIAIAVLQFALWLGGASLVIFSSYDTMGLTLVAVSVFMGLLMFLRGDGPATRKSVIYEVLLPVSYLAYLFFGTHIDRLGEYVERQTKTKRVEQVGTEQPATRLGSKSEGGDKPQTDSEERSR